MATQLDTAMDVMIRPTTEVDLPVVLSILDEAAAWLQEIGMKEQWPLAVSQDATFLARVTRLVSEGRFYVATAGSEAVGVFNLRDEPSLESGPGGYWTLEDMRQPAVYLFQLAVRRTVAGQGVAAAMLEWAFQAARARDRVLRLDCWAGNDRLRRYYLDAGFDHLGDVEGGDNTGRYYAVSRFERRV